jgi:hypothetical protein
MRNLMRTLALAGAFALALPAVASADNWHGRGHGYGHYKHGAPVYYAPPCPPRVVYAPVVYAQPVYYPRAVYLAPPPVAFFPPVISVRTPNVAVTIGGWLPF